MPHVIFVHTIIGMDITFDPAKDAINVAKHGISLHEAEKFEWDTAITWPDMRRDYGEVRMAGIGYVGSRLHYMARRRPAYHQPPQGQSEGD